MTTAQDPIANIDTPSRFLLECGELNFTPGFDMATEIDPFESSLRRQDDPPITPPKSPQEDRRARRETTETRAASAQHRQPYHHPLSPSPIAHGPSEQSQWPGLSPSPSPSPPSRAATAPTTLSSERVAEPAPRPKRSAVKRKTTGDSAGGSRKRRAASGGANSSNPAQDERTRFLERNRVAASKCRQKKKKWMQELESRAELVSTRNKELTALVSQLRDETLYLRNQLLTHGNCDCSVVQSYLQRTSVQLSSNPSASSSASATAAAAAVAEATSSLDFWTDTATTVHPSSFSMRAPAATSTIST